MRALPPPPHSLEHRRPRRLPFPCLPYVFLGVLLFSPAAVGFISSAQSTPSTPPAAQKPSTDASQQKPGRVTTTVVVHGDVKEDYLNDAGTAGSLDNTP